MCKIQIRLFLAGLFVAAALGAQGFAQSPQSRPQHTCESDPLKAQANSIIDRETAARAEERAESLRAKLFDLAIKELDLLARLDDLDYRSSPEGIQRTLAFVGSARPMDELREALRLRLEREKARANSQLDLLASIRERLETAIREADAEIERVRQR
jgi:hypothetical protein